MWAQSAPKSLNETNAYGFLNAVYIPFHGINTVSSRNERSAQIGVRRLKLISSSVCHGRTPFIEYPSRSRIQRKIKYKPTSVEYMSNLVIARLFGYAIFETSKLNVLFLDVDEGKYLPRTYTLTHSDITACLTLTVSRTINKAQLQGWYRRLQRDEVVAEWIKSQGKMALHVHCHISGGHWLLDVMAKLRFSIFRKELPLVLKAFRHGDEALFNSYPEFEKALVWVHFHSNVKEYNCVECWGPLEDAAKREASEIEMENGDVIGKDGPRRCPHQCDCCYPPLEGGAKEMSPST